MLHHISRPAPFLSDVTFPAKVESSQGHLVAKLLEFPHHRLASWDATDYPLLKKIRIFINFPKFFAGRELCSVFVFSGDEAAAYTFCTWQESFFLLFQSQF
jgi:hypothetical protein